MLALPMMALAGNIKSPNGNIELKFSVDKAGRPLYEMTYKGHEVIKPSHLGLELAKDKHASKGMDETDLMEGFKIVNEETSTFDGARQPPSVITTTSMLLCYSNKHKIVRLSSASVCTTTV